MSTTETEPCVRLGVRVKNGVGETEMRDQSEQTLHRFFSPIFMRWVVPLPTLDHNHMYPVISCAHLRLGRPPPATAPLQEDIETTALSQDQRTLGQPDRHVVSLVLELSLQTPPDSSSAHCTMQSRGHGGAFCGATPSGRKTTAIKRPETLSHRLLGCF